MSTGPFGVVVRLMILGAGAIAGLLVCSPVANAAPPGPAFTYQGQLKLSGVPVNGTADFEFTLWDAPAAGTQIGALSAANNVTLVSGLFTATLNAGNEFGAAAFDGNARWLQIAVRSPAGGGAFTPLAQRQSLTPTPFSHALELPAAETIAGSSDLLSITNSGGSGSAGVFSLTNVGNLSAALRASAAGTATALSASTPAGGTAVDAASGLGRAGRFQSGGGLPAVTAINTSTGPAIHADGNVGIGTASPGRKLDIATPGSARIANLLSTGPHLELKGAAAGVSLTLGSVDFLDGTDVKFGAVYYQRSIFGDRLILNAGQADHVFLDQDGRLGVGIAIPAARFQVAQDFYVNTDLNFVGVGRNTRVTGSEVFGLYSNTTGFGGMYVQTAAGGDPFYGYSSGGEADAWTYYDGDTAQWRLFANGIRMAVDRATGTVAIGTTTIPAGARLAVNGKILSEEVEVQLATDWPDYVFDDDYPLVPLDRLEQYVRSERRLPDLPSADEVKSEGLAVGEMNARLLRKIEELTLYVIQLDGGIRELRDENHALRERVAELEGGVVLRATGPLGPQAGE